MQGPNRQKAHEVEQCGQLIDLMAVWYLRLALASSFTLPAARTRERGC